MNTKKFKMLPHSLSSELSNLSCIPIQQKGNQSKLKSNILLVTYILGRTGYVQRTVSFDMVQCTTKSGLEDYICFYLI